MEKAFHVALMLEADSQNCQDSIDTILSCVPLILYFLILHKTCCLLPKFYMN